MPDFHTGSISQLHRSEEPDFVNAIKVEEVKRWSAFPLPAENKTTITGELAEGEKLSHTHTHTFRVL